MPDDMLVSIIIPCYDDGKNYNHSKYLQGALMSALRQEPPYEVIVVDDGSACHDNIKAITDRFGASVRLVVSDVNRGLAGARNFGIVRSHGRFVLTLDSDDELTSNAVSNARSAFLMRPDGSVVFGHMLNLYTREYYSMFQNTWTLRYLIESSKLCNTAMFTREAWQEVGGYDEKLRACEDWDFWISLASSGHKFIFINQPLLLVRPQNIGEDHLSHYGIAHYDELYAYISNKHKDAFELSDERFNRVVATPV